MQHKVLISTSGIGSRLGNLTSYTNKSLVRVGSKPAIAHIIESYPVDTSFVVTLGHFGQQVRDFLDLAYPERTFEYVVVEAYQGPGTSLGLSMLAAKDLLQCPFIYHAGDTIVEHPELLSVDMNWIAVYPGKDTSQYSSWIVRERKLQLQEKGAIDSELIHIGVIGVYDFVSFWSELNGLYAENPEDSSLNDCRTIARMVEKDVEFKLINYLTWYDIGNVDALHTAREKFGTSADDLDKEGEAVFIFDTFVMKFFSDAKLAQNRAERGLLLKGFVPEVEGVRGNFYRYAFVPGDLYPHVVTSFDFKIFLSWAQDSFWKEEFIIENEEFKNRCRLFYLDKTKKRIEQFLLANNLKDTEHVINGEKVPSLAKMLEDVDFDYLSAGLQSRFHGDFILDNIIKTDDSYCLIDWRQDFGGLLESGDRYYDLAKLNHNLTINHRVVNHNLFTVESDSHQVRCEIMRPSILVECQDVFLDFAQTQGYDVQKIKILTAIIWLNMAPLHHYPFNLFLYYFGKFNLWQSLQSK